MNLAVAAALSAGLAVVGTPAAGALAFAAAALVVYLRGYLVPGTPTLTARYLPNRVLRLFGKVPAEDGLESPPEDDGFLGSCGVVERSASDDRRLAPPFRSAWNDRIRALRDGQTVDAEAVAELFVVDAASAVGNRGYLVDGERIVQWESDAALLADVAAGRELRERCPAWTEGSWSVDQRVEALARLRALRRECPACGGSLSKTERRVESCCQPPKDVLTAVCTECDAQVAEVLLSNGNGRRRERDVDPASP
ncbi:MULTISPECIES: hypothetical protein [Halorussus]|uniref:hypothetical protein n=1 Tax=Halorussus TaxID=1070314 RepID=UPI0020A18B36|nr:hypothetical protein [Halorussus vallis]USZ77504.1 hypothetical protein NGM07_09250 [Halorussus vallis]